MPERSASAAAPDRRPPTPGGARENAWLLAALAVAGFAGVARIHNAFAYVPLQGYDAGGHALYVYSLYEGQLPSPTSWSGFHPPLYYALGALAWIAGPEAWPVHAMARLIAAAAGFGAVWVAWRVASRWLPRADAAAACAVVCGAPVFALATSMVGNETTVALFLTCVLARLLSLPARPEALPRHAVGTALLAALALLSKATGLVGVGVAGLAYLVSGRRSPRHALLAAALIGAIPALVAAPHYARVIRAAGGSLGAITTGASVSPELAEAMAEQPPGERHLRHYLSIPPALFREPVHAAPGMTESVPGLLYASIWADAHAHFLVPVSDAVLRAQALMVAAGLVPTALALLGAWLLLRRRGRESWPALLLAALLAVALLRYTWALPRYSAVKASYLLGAILPAVLALSCGLSAVRGAVARPALRALLLGIGLGGSALTWYGWWRP